MSIEITEAVAGLWNEFVAESADATFGHIWQWREIISAAYGFESFYLMARDASGRPLAAAPFIFLRSRLYGNELASMPYIDYGGVCHADALSSSERLACDHLLFEHAKKLALKLNAKRLHIRSPRPCEAPFEVAEHKVTQHLALVATAKEQLRGLPSERRNRLRHCERLALTTEIVPAVNSAQLLEFFRIYAANMRDLGSPTHSYRFFDNVTSRLKERINLILIRHEERAIAAAIAFEFRGVKSLPWSGATLDARPMYGTNALYWAAIKQGIETGCHTFDFGRSSVGSGIFEFKRRWGPSPVQAYWSTLYIGQRAEAPKQQGALRIGSRVWRHLPLSVSRVFGPPLRKGISN